MAADVHVWFLVAVFCLILSIHVVGSENSLYTTDDHVTILNADNFYSVVPRSQNAWFLEFYSSWCGHCIRFAPTWKQLAKDTAGKLNDECNTFKNKIKLGGGGWMKLHPILWYVV